MTCRPFAVSLLTACLAAGAAAGSARADTSTAADAPAVAPDEGSPPCNVPFSVYRVSPDVLPACGIQTSPPGVVDDLPGGGHSYSYSTADGGSTTYFEPPDDFDPLTADDQQLVEYGFPPRPTDPAAQAHWLELMSNVHMVPAPPFVAQVPVSADGGVQDLSIATTADADGSTSGTFDNWSGFMDNSGVNAFDKAEGVWYEPGYGSSVCSSPRASIWAGLGGWMNDNTAHHKLAQDGTAYNVPSMDNHQGWTEFWDNEFMQPANIYASAGHRFDALTQFLTQYSDGSANFHFFMHNYWTGATLSFDRRITNFPVDVRDAEVVAERPTVNNVYSDLANFQTLSVDGAWVNDDPAPSTSTSMGAWTGRRYRMQMRNRNNGDTLATTSTLSNAGQTFSITQTHCH